MCKSCPKRAAQRRVCCNALVAFLLTISVAAYVFLGGFIFERLDRKYTVYPARKQPMSEEEVLKEIWNITQEMNIMKEDNWTTLVQEQLHIFEKQLILSIQRNWVVERPEKKQHRYISSLFYCLAIITTIGYGNMAPQSMTGKVATMIYATTGVPLMFLCVLKLGTFFAAVLRCFYAQVCCCMCVRPTPHLDTNSDSEIITDDDKPYVVLKQVRKLSPHSYSEISIIQPTENHVIKRHASKESIYTNVNDEYEQKPEIEPNCTVVDFSKTLQNESHIENKVMLHKCNSVASQNTKTLYNRSYDTFDNAGPSVCSENQVYIKQLTNSTNPTDIEALSDKSSENVDHNEITVPVVLCLFIFSGYVSAGMALLLKIADCTFLEGIYYCFLSLCSISFGDLISKGIIYRTTELQFGLMCLYLWFGMGLVMMCVILVRQAAHQQWYWIKTDFVKAGGNRSKS